MKPIYSIEYTKEARRTYDKTIDFILGAWPVEIALKIEGKIDEFIDFLRYFKHLCRPSFKKTSVRRCTITKYTSMTYRVIESRKVIQILAFRDNRSGKKKQ